MYKFNTILQNKSVDKKEWIPAALFDNSLWYSIQTDQQKEDDNNTNDYQQQLIHTQYQQNGIG